MKSFSQPFFNQLLGILLSEQYIEDNTWARVDMEFLIEKLSSFHANDLLSTSGHLSNSSSFDWFTALSVFFVIG